MVVKVSVWIKQISNVGLYQFNTSCDNNNNNNNNNDFYYNFNNTNNHDNSNNGIFKLNFYFN